MAPCLVDVIEITILFVHVFKQLFLSEVNEVAECLNMLDLLLAKNESEDHVPYLVAYSDVL